MKSKFLTLLESINSKFQRGGFLTGNYVKFIDGYKGKSSYKDLSPDMKDIIDEFDKSDLHLRITDIKNYMPSSNAGTNENQNGCVVLDIAQDTGGGRRDPNRVVTVASDLVINVDYAPGYAPIPDSQVRPNNEILKPEPLKSEDSEEIKRSRMSDVGGKLQKGDRELLNKNVEIPAVMADKVPDPGVASYTIRYLKEK